MRTFSLVVATEKHNGIGKDGGLPWSLKGDMRWFKELTTCPDRLAVQARYRLDRAIIDKHIVTPEQLIAQLGKDSGIPKPAPEARNAVLMGRRTWESLPDRFRPLPGRVNGVLSRQPGFKSDGTFQIWTGLDEALSGLQEEETLREIFVIGGGQVYAAALEHPRCARIYRTFIDADFACDTFFPATPADFAEIASTPWITEPPFTYRIQMLEREIKA